MTKLKPSQVKPGMKIVQVETVPWPGHTVARTKVEGGKRYFLLAEVDAAKGGYWWDCREDLVIYVQDFGDPEDGPYGP